MSQLVFWSALLILVIVYMFYWVYSLIKGAPYYPSNRKVVNSILEVLDAKGRNLSVAELGAGDGRVANAIAKQGHNVDAFEINPFLTLIIRLKKAIGKHDTLSIYRDDFLHHDFSKYDVLITYLYPGIMEKIEEKLIKEAKSGTIVISNTFKFKNLSIRSSKLDGKVKIYQFE